MRVQGSNNSTSRSKLGHSDEGSCSPRVLSLCAWLLVPCSGRSLGVAGHWSALGARACTLLSVALEDVTLRPEAHTLGVEPLSGVALRGVAWRAGTRGAGASRAEGAEGAVRRSGGGSGQGCGRRHKPW